jgi:CheY-like chemotaxis protein
MSRILHVEDEDTWRNFVKRALADHHIDSAASTEEALRFLQGGAPYHLALVDLSLIRPGDLLGGEILDLLRARYPTTRRIVVTGNPPGGPLRANIFERYEVEEIIIKGQLTLPDLRRVVENALDQTKWGAPHQVKLHRSELRQRFRDWRRGQASLMTEKIRDAEEYARNAEKLSGQAGRRAQDALKVILDQQDGFWQDCLTIESELDGIVVMEDVFKAMEELDTIEAKYAGGVLDQQADSRYPEQ